MRAASIFLVYTAFYQAFFYCELLWYKIFIMRYATKFKQKKKYRFWNEKT